MLKNIIETQEKKVTIEQIQKRVSEHFGLRAQDLKVRSNSKVISFPRQVAMFLVKQLVAAAISSVWAFAFTYGMLWLIDRVTPVKVDEAVETRGLDDALHGETAYAGTP